MKIWTVRNKILALVLILTGLIAYLVARVVWSYDRAQHQIQIVGASLNVMSALMQTRLAIITQISLSTDYVYTRQEREQKDHAKLKQIVRDSFGDWSRSIDRYVSLVPEGIAEWDRFEELEAAYTTLDERIEKAFSLLENGEEDNAYAMLEGTEMDHQADIEMNEAFHHAENQEIKEFEESYQSLVMKIGAIPFSKKKTLNNLIRARYLFHHSIGANKVCVNILKQYREFIDFLISADAGEIQEFAAFGVKAEVYFEEWSAVQKTHAGIALVSDRETGELIDDISNRYGKFLEISRQAIQFRENGVVDEAFLMERKLPDIIDAFFTEFFTKINNAWDNIDKTHQTVQAEFYAAARNTIVLFVLTGIILLYMLLQMVRGIFRPLNRLREGTQIIGQGKLDHRIVVGGDDELGRLAASFNSMTASLEEDNQRRAAMEQRPRLLSSHALTAQENERRRIARELHDGIGQSLSLLKLQFGSLKKHLPGDREELGNQYVAITNTLDDLIENTRSVSRELSPPILEDLGISVAARRLLEDFSNHYDARCTIEIENIDTAMVEKAQIAVYRILQEALTNIERHANASEVICRIKNTRKAILVSIEDNGEGFDSAAVASSEMSEGGMGLVTMAERARMVGGSLKIESAIGLGTGVTLTIPCHQQAKNNHGGRPNHHR